MELRFLMLIWVIILMKILLARENNIKQNENKNKMLNRLSFLSENDDPQKYKGYMIEKVNIGQVMNQYQIVTDADHVYVEKGNSQGKINKSDLISKLLAASELDKIKIISKSVVVNQKLSLGLKNGLYFLIGSGNFGFCDLVSVYKKEITVIANEGYGTLIIGTDNIIAGQHCIYINETDNKIEFKQYSDVMNVTFGGIIA